MPLSLLLAPSRLTGIPNWIGVLWLGLMATPLLFTRLKVRIGDLIAGTAVVAVPKARLLTELALERFHSGRGDEIMFTPSQLDVYGIHELQVLEDILRTDPEFRDKKLFDVVASKIAGKIGYDWSSDRAGAEKFLRAFYTAQRARLESKLLMGKRKRHKQDED